MHGYVSLLPDSKLGMDFGGFKREQKTNDQIKEAGT